MGLMGLMGCSGEVTSVPGAGEPQQDSIPIGFRAAVLNGGTRAGGGGELTTASLQATGFGVYCWYTEDRDVAFTDSKGTTPSTHISTYAKYMLMRNQKVEWKKWDGESNPASWNYTPSKYWPLDPREKLTFRAYAPYSNYQLTDGTTGLPLLPVVVDADDYHNNTQPDPLWGTSKHDGTVDGDDAELNNEVYGRLYNNYTYPMSGTLLAADERDGCIDWYFHHGMAKLIFWGMLSEDSNESVDEVTITGITLTPLYNQGLLDISSPVGDASDKPYWEDCSGTMSVTIDGDDLRDDNNDPTNVINTTSMTQLTSKGLLIIPRNFSELTPMTLTVTFLNGKGDEVSMSSEITQKFQGNTVYTLKMTVSNILYVEIDVVQSAFDNWEDQSADHTVYNW